MVLGRLLELEARAVVVSCRWRMECLGLLWDGGGEVRVGVRLGSWAGLVFAVVACLLRDFLVLFDRWGSVAGRVFARFGMMGIKDGRPV